MGSGVDGDGGVVGVVEDAADDPEEAERQILGRMAETPVGAYLVYGGRGVMELRDSDEALQDSKPLLGGFEHARHLIAVATGRATPRRAV